MTRRGFSAPRVGAANLFARKTCGQTSLHGNRILAAVLVAQLVLVIVVFWPRATSRGPTAVGLLGAAGGESLFAGLEADQIVRMTIRDGEGEQIVLEKSEFAAKGAEGWVLPEMDDYPCKEKVVPELLDKIVELKTGRLVAQTRDSHKRLKVSDQDFAHLIEFDLADGGSHKLYLGTSPSYSVIHVRADGQDQVYLASDLSSADVGARPATWIDTLYFSVPQDQVMAVTLENGNGHFEFEKGEDGEWTMKDLAPGETLNTANVTSLVNRVTSVRMLRPLGKQAQEAYGLQSPSAVVVIYARSAEGTSTTYMLHVGAKSEAQTSLDGNTYVLKSSESPYYVRVAEYTVKDWIEKTRDGFLELPPTPTPTPAS